MTHDQVAAILKAIEGMEKQRDSAARQAERKMELAQQAREQFDALKEATAVSIESVGALSVVEAPVKQAERNAETAIAYHERLAVSVAQVRATLDRLIGTGSTASGN